MGDEEKRTSDAGAGTAAAAEAPMEQPASDEHTTAPNPPQMQDTSAKKWEMPKPVFKQTSGYLPQGFVKDIRGASGPDDGAISSTPAPAAASGVSVPAVAAAAVEPQPDLSDQLIPEETTAEAAPVVPKKAGVTTPMVVLGLIAVIAFFAVFLTVIYFLFFRTPGGTNNF